MHVQISLLVVCVEAIIYLLLYNLHDCTTLNQKHNVGWFLPKKFVDLFRERYIINRKHSNTFLLIDLQKTKLVQSKTLVQGLFVLISDF